MAPSPASSSPATAAPVFLAELHATVEQQPPDVASEFCRQELDKLRAILGLQSLSKTLVLVCVHFSAFVLEVKSVSDFGPALVAVAKAAGAARRHCKAHAQARRCWTTWRGRSVQTCQLLGWPHPRQLRPMSFWPSCVATRLTRWPVDRAPACLPRGMARSRPRRGVCSLLK